MKLDLSSLAGLKLKEVEKTTVVRGANVIPENGDIKIFSNGKIFFSPEFRELVDGGALDIVDSRKWNLYPKDAEQFPIYVCIVPKEQLANNKVSAKVDIRKESTNAPISAVTNVLIPLLKEMYGLVEEFGHVELKVEYDFPLTNEKGKYQIPKVISSGDKKGLPTYAVREHVTFYPITIVGEEVEETNEEIANTISEETVTASETITE